MCSVETESGEVKFRCFEAIVKSSAKDQGCTTLR